MNDRFLLAGTLLGALAGLAVLFGSPNSCFAQEHAPTARAVGFMAQPGNGSMQPGRTLESARSLGSVPIDRKSGERFAGPVDLRVRMVRADGDLPDDKPARQTVDRRLNDIAGRLTKVGYRQFTLMDIRRDVIEPRRREAIQLSDGYLLMVRLNGVEEHKLNVWLKWQDRSGAVLLDTRVTVGSGEPIIAGTEMSDDCGVLLIVDVAVKN